MSDLFSFIYFFHLRQQRATKKAVTTNKQKNKKLPPVSTAPDNVPALLGNAWLTRYRTCQHQQPLLMSRLQGGGGRGFLQGGLANVVVRLSPEGAYIYTIRGTVTSLSRSSKWVRWDGSLRGEWAQMASIRHGVLQLDCGALMLLSHRGSAVSAALSQREGHRFHLASL